QVRRQHRALDDQAGERLDGAQVLGAVALRPEEDLAAAPALQVLVALAAEGVPRRWAPAGPGPLERATVTPGSDTSTRVPPPGRPLAQIFPRCASTIRRAMYRPMPMPSAPLPETNGSKSRQLISAGMPAPSSSTASTALPCSSAAASMRMPCPGPVACTALRM